MEDHVDRAAPMQPLALIFDVDGTLADTEEAHRQAFNRAFAEHELDWNWGTDDYRQLLAVAGGKERIAAWSNTLTLSAADRKDLWSLIPHIHATKTRLYTSMVRDGQVPLRSGVRRLILEARNAGIRIAIATTTTPENVEALLTATLGREAPAWFAAIAAGDIVARKKPAPDIYACALETLQLPARACIAFEDSVNGLAAAQGAGLCTVITPTAWTAHQDFDGADLVLPSLGDPWLPETEATERIGRSYVGLAELEALHEARHAATPPVTR